MRNLLLRLLTAAAVIVSAVVHLKLWFDGFQDIPVIGPLFLLNVIGGFAIGVAVLVWRHWLPLLAGAGFGIATLGAFILSATVGLFGIHETWTGTPQILAAVSEVVAILGAAAALNTLDRGSALDDLSTDDVHGHIR